MQGLQANHASVIELPEVPGIHTLARGDAHRGMRPGGTGKPACSAAAPLLYKCNTNLSGAFWWEP